MSNPGIIIKNAGKGGIVVILDKGAYLEEANRILSYTEYHRTISSDPSSTSAKIYSELIMDAYINEIPGEKKKICFD